MTMYDELARSTLSIDCGTSRGSGFHFLEPEIIITNRHVVEECIDEGELTIASTEDGDDFELELISSSPDNHLDFAIFRSTTAIPEGRSALRPKILDGFVIGMELAFAGFPHGIDDLLVQQAIVSGELDDDVFYIDGSVNEGNSGGPIVDASDGALVGIVTERRFLGGADLDQLQQAAEQIQEHWEQIGGGGGVAIMGIDFAAFTALMAQAMVLIKDVLEANANTGIGIGYSAKFVTQECEQLGIGQ